MLFPQSLLRTNRTKTISIIGAIPQKEQRDNKYYGYLIDNAKNFIKSALTNMLIGGKLFTLQAAVFDLRISVHYQTVAGIYHEMFPCLHDRTQNHQKIERIVLK
jgi:hypothetical protein